MINVEIVKKILASDIVSWVLGFLGGIIAFRVVHRMQTTIGRHGVIKDMEQLINKFLSSNIAMSNIHIKDKSNGGNIEPADVNVRTILHDDIPWDISFLKGQEDKIKIKRDKRYISIRKNDVYDEYISTQALHESLIIFRRIEKLYKDYILKPIDLADWWRELLPFATSKRLEFYVAYFSEEDIRSMVFVLFNTVLACNKYKVYKAVEYFKKYYNANPSIHKYFHENIRYRLNEKIKIRKFNKIMN